MFSRRHGSRSLFSIAGWLFADLLLALTVIFISANTIGSKPPKIVRPTPTPTPTITPQASPILELHYITIHLTISNPALLLRNDPTAVQQLKQEVMAVSQLKGRRAGLVVVYGGAPTVGDIQRAEEIGQTIINVLQSLKNDNTYQVFANTSYYGPLYGLGDSETQATVDVFLFTK